ncbi:PEP-utilizing enzyme, mobile domain [Candidatus Micrarchaeum sp.]|jgi:phosphoenolpyruvate-protein kinase (PTS system EI component)|uniref:PEP-utilizing enzyme n=1 Tax=Candidatus Micrarchaeum sp. TaxID=2282148 RepID=UPI00092777DD|nr:PEP-utilizing enzyme [Candidatus Micrarchaeum sp.]OJI07157.1 MAG: hypothetical protein BK997_03645 [Candidatus Micrarchaeum sp. ARMAN-1]OJT94767.1 MAG: hypothetical protein JJ59_01660 [Candidatus Micrarchaeum sp. AZ1]OWP53682.1 MAG: hypothetical protein B2I19_01895 [Thermoplasmatales archaeon ARMAN]QRF74267.1 PEP-utilizing enzyme, mobile domain [Candidatus Micrarchaeum sp.]
MSKNDSKDKETTGRVLLRKENQQKLEGRVVSYGKADTMCGIAMHLTPETKYIPVTIPKPLILLVEDGTIHEAELNPDIFYASDAIIMKTGGELAHIAVIARERGILAVSEIPVDKIKNGTKVTIKTIDLEDEIKALVEF